MALSFEKGDRNIMNEKPRDPKESIFDKQMIEQVLLSGLIIGLIVFFTWYFLNTRTTFSTEKSRGFVMMLMVFLQNFHVLNCRREKESFFKVSIASNWFVVISISLAILSQVLVSNVPLLAHFLKIEVVSLNEGLMIILLSIPILVIMEIYKIIKFGGLRGRKNS